MQVLKSMLYCVAATMLFAACNNNDDAAPTAMELQVNVLATIEAPACCSTAWEAGDTFGLWSRTHSFADNNVPFTVADPAMGHFLGLLSIAEHPSPHTLHAFYAYRENRGFDPSYLAVQIPANQSQSGGVCDLRRYGFLTASASEVDLSGGVASLNFTTPCAILCVRLDASGTDAAAKRATQLTLHAEQPVVGNLVYNLEDGRVEIPASGRSVKLTLDDKPTLDAVRPFYIVAQPGEWVNNNLTLSIQCEDKSTIDMSLNRSASLVAGEVAEFSVPLAELIASGDAEFNEFRYDLSENGTANCYIVTKADKYKFRPTKGNSSETPAGIERVDWLWMSEADLITNVKYGKGGITFDAGDKRGNAVIAAFNAANEVVWSWHIWLTDDPTTNGHTASSDKYYLLDRNLGATSTEAFNPNSYGLYYQWGRKDPFVGQRNAGSGTRFQETEAFSEITAAHVTNGGYAFTTVTNEVVGTTKASAVEYITKNPMTFVYAKITTYGSSWWNSAYTDYEDLWGYGTTKSIYDPCPVGYRVPRTEITFGTDQIVDHWDVLDQVLENGRTIYSYGYMGPAKSEVLSHYPAAGYRYHVYTTHASSGTHADGGAMGHTGAVGYYWSNCLRPKSNNVWMLELDKGGNIIHGSRRNNGHSARGCSVRCEKE